MKHTLASGEEVELPLSCIVCGKKMEFAFPEAVKPRDGTPLGGLMFTSHGNYGSLVFDALDDRESLRVNICDECVTRHAAQGHVLHVTVTPQRPKRKTELFKP